MCGTSKGFTLIEVLIALSIVSLSFTVLLEVLYSSSQSYEQARERFRDFLILDRKLKEGSHEGLEVVRKELPDFPRMKEVLYHYRGLFFVRYEAN